MCIINNKRLIIITNCSYESHSASVQASRLLQEGTLLADAKVIKNISTDIDFCGYNSGDVVIFLDKDIYCARQLELSGVRVCNSSSAISICDDKAQTLLAVKGVNDVIVPHTIIAPKLYFGCPNDEFLHTVQSKIGYPIVVKECIGSLGQQVYLAHNFDELKALAIRIGVRPHMYQTFVAESRGKSLRVYVAGGRVVACGRLVNNNDFRSNAESGGTMVPIKISKRMESAVLAIAARLGLSFGGIDMFDTEEPIFIEANSNAYFAELERSSGINIAKAIVQSVIGSKI